MTETAIETPTFRHFIAGEWCDSTSGATFESRNPADRRDVVGRFQQGTAADVAMAIKAAETAGPMWRRTPAPKRGEILYAFGALMAQHKERLARAMTREMGKVLSEARGDVQEGIDIAFLMAGEGRRMYGETVPSELPDKWAMSIRQPIGIAGIITPWNFPMAIPCWKIMPALVTGNMVVFKPASDTPHCATLLVELMAEAGVPPGVVNLVTGSGWRGRRRDRRNAGHRRSSRSRARPRPARPSPRRPGRAQAPVAGARRQERRGRPGRRGPRPRHRRHPVVGLRHDRAALHGLLAGHRRTLGRRAVPGPARDARPQGPAPRLRTRRGADVGPLINAGAVDKVASYVDIGLGEGELVIGGGRATGDELAHGHFFEPTIFAGVGPMDRIGQEEIFGPVLSVIPVADYGAAMLALNQTRYGLSSSIFTQDVNTAFRAMRDFETGIVYVNAGTTGAETHLPFGGWKETGNGHREAGNVALDTYTEWKSIYVDFSGRLQRAQIDNQPN